MSASRNLPTLNLNSMMDMLSIILVFLLCNSSAGEEIIIPHALTLPHSNSHQAITNDVQVRLSRDELRIGDAFVAKVEGSRLVGVELEGDKIVPLYNRLQRRLVTRTRPPGDKPTVVLLADRDFPFKIVNKVMRTSAMAGYPYLRLTVQKQ